jgi:hypothetical protein
MGLYDRAQVGSSVGRIAQGNIDLLDSGACRGQNRKMCNSLGVAPAWYRAIWTNDPL